ncbi:MAG: hypothetical protein E7543_02825 [Ruminococcaceae bacterium]|nr:hypothetical protein [Oscillospiraceae bacterium]
MKTKKAIKVLVFLLIFLFGFFGCQTVLADGDSKDYKRINGFFDERENSLDAVFLGSSATYAFWTPPVAFAEYGITVYSFSNAAQPTFAARYLIEDARKTQPDALYIINISHLLENYGNHLHKLLVNYPNSINKLEMTDYLCDMGGLSLSERMEHYFPIIRFHERWSELTKEDFKPSEDKYKCGSTYTSFLSKTTDVSGLKYDFETRAELSENDLRGLTELMDYCEQTEVKVLFVIVPQAVSDKERFAEQNTTADILTGRGFDVLDLRKHTEEIGLDLSADYYNAKHTNLHGSLKITDYISRYLVENYGFGDKRGQEEYSDWTEASAKYYEKISEYLTPAESERLGLQS